MIRDGAVMTVPDDYGYFVRLGVRHMADGAVSIGWWDDEDDLLIATD